MRILFVTQWFDPEPTFKGLAFARELTKRGHQVQVLTGFPNYPGGKLYDGYRVRPVQREQIDGIDIVRVPLYPSHSKSTVGRVANYASFAASAATIGAATVGRPDVIYAYHPPATVGVPALFLRSIYRAPLVYDIQDLWPDSLTATGMIKGSLALGTVDRLCRMIYQHADHLAVLSPGLRDVLVRRGVSAQKVSVIYNWCDEAQIAIPDCGDGALPLQEWRDKFLVLFAGTMGLAQSLDTVLHAAAILARERGDVQFVFVGGGIDADRIKAEASRLRLPNVAFVPRMPVGDIGPVLARADVLLVHLKDDPLFRITIPSKTQAYMAAGRPILMAIGGDAGALVRQAGCGVVCRSESPNELADAVRQLAGLTAEERRQLGRHGKSFYDAHLSLAAGTDKFEAIFRRLHHSRGRPCEPEMPANRIPAA